MGPTKTPPIKTAKKGQLKTPETSPTDVTMETGVVMPSKVALANPSSQKNKEVEDSFELESDNTMQLILEAAGMKPPPPDSTAKKATPAFYSFELIADKGDKHFKNSKEALAFKQDYPEMILKEHKFTSFLRFTNHIKRCSARTVVAPAAIRRTAMAVDEQDDEASNRIAALLAQQRPVDHIIMKYKTNPTCTMVYGTINAITMWMSLFWGFKAAQIAPVLQSYSSIIPHPDMFIQEALQNMSFGKTRDTDSTDRNQAKVINYTPPGKKDVIVIDVYTMYTFFKIPFTTINTSAEEAVWLKDKCEKLLEETRRIMLTSVFKSVLAKMGNTLFFEKLFDPKRKSNLPKFLNGCIIRVEECEVFTDDVVQEVSNRMVTGMYEASLPTRKYPELTLEADFEAEAETMGNTDEPDEHVTAAI
jgi:hypothetical protein